MVNIRFGVQKDASELTALCRETFYCKWQSNNTEEDLTCYMNEFFNIEKIEKELTDPTINYLLAFYHAQLIGYIKLNRNSAEGDLENLKPIEIQRMYVLEQFIGNGIGREMMNCALEFAVKEKFEVIWLGAWEKNSGALKFYKRFGFDVYGEHQFILGADVTTDLLLKKIL